MLQIEGEYYSIVELETSWEKETCFSLQLSMITEVIKTRGRRFNPSSLEEGFSTPKNAAIQGCYFKCSQEITFNTEEKSSYLF